MVCDCTGCNLDRVTSTKSDGLTSDPLRSLPPEIFGSVLYYGGFDYADRCRIRSVCRAWRDFVNKDPRTYDSFYIGYNASIPLCVITELVRKSLGTLRVTVPKERHTADAMWPNFRERHVSQLFVSLHRIKDIYFYTRTLYDHTVTPITSQNFIPELNWRFLYRVPPKAAKSNDLRVLYHAGVDEGFFRAFMQNVTDLPVWYQEADLSLIMKSWLQWDGWKESLVLSILAWVQAFDLRVDSMLAFFESVGKQAHSIKRLTNLKFYSNLQDKPAIDDLWNRKLELPDSVVFFPNVSDLRINEKLACDSPVEISSPHRMTQQQLEEIIRHMPNLTTFVLNHTVVHCDADAPAFDFSQYNLSRLDLTGSDLHKDPVVPNSCRELLTSCSNILPRPAAVTNASLLDDFESNVDSINPVLENVEHLDLRQHKLIQNDNIHQIFSIFDCSALTTLLLSRLPVKIDCALIDRFHAAYPHLATLDIGYNNSVEDNLLQYIFKIKYDYKGFQHLTDLNVSHTEISDKGLESIAESERQHANEIDVFNTTTIVIYGCTKVTSNSARLTDRMLLTIAASPILLHTTRTYNFDRRSAGFSDKGRCFTCSCSEIW
ncbi:uncharacterized protein V2V93DRAFT_369212 [Kockiozyma suomiensis]|uniref:uncharacterized protein n=1 Tax=Kockiozyma suomiensis TaxID=1337062 RepID=UPI003342EC31